MDQNQETTEAAVVQPVVGTTTVSMTAPTPEWVRKTVRACTWITAVWAMLSINIDLADFGVNERAGMLILKYSAAFTGLISVVARFIGVKPVNLIEDK